MPDEDEELIIMAPHTSNLWKARHLQPKKTRQHRLQRRAAIPRPPSELRRRRNLQSWNRSQATPRLRRRKAIRRVPQCKCRVRERSIGCHYSRAPDRSFLTITPHICDLSDTEDCHITQRMWPGIIGLTAEAHSVNRDQHSYGGSHHHHRH